MAGQGAEHAAAPLTSVLTRVTLAGLSALALSALQGVVLVVTVAITGTVAWSLAMAGSVAALAAGGSVRRRRRSRRARAPSGSRGWRWAGLVAGASVLSAVGFILPREAGVTMAAGGTRLSLEDGTHLATRTYRARSVLPPVVLVHGGPGVPFTHAEEAALVRASGVRTVISYDQIGTGGSSRLQDPAGYTLQRSVDDLAQVVAATDHERVILVAHSWGSSIALTYAAQNPDDVEAMVLMSPGPFPWRDEPWPVVAPQDRLDVASMIRLYARALTPRNLFVYALTAADPTVAHELAGDAEMDGRFADIYERITGGLTCDGGEVPADVRLGYYASQVPQLHPDGAGVTPAQVRRLATVPVLVLRGACDYVAPEIAGTYGQQLGARVVPVRGSGHSIAVEQPQRLVMAVTSFLRSLRPAMLNGGTAEGGNEER